MAGGTLWLTDSGAVTLPAFPDEWTGHREESWSWRLLELDGAPAGDLDGVRPDSTLEFSVHNTIRGGGTMRWAGSDVPDLSRKLVQPWYTMQTLSGTRSWPLGVFIPSTPVVDWSSVGATADVELYDKLLLLDRDKVEETYTADAGTVVTDEVEAIVTGIGERLSIPASAETLTGPLVWEAGTSKLRIVNDLHAAINYFALTVDGYGVFRAVPYTAPSARPLAWPFLDNQHGLYLPRFRHERDTFDVPNKIVCISQTSGDGPALIGTATNTDPDSPTSYQARGNKWFTDTYTGIEATSQAVIDAIAERRLVEATQTASTVDFTHPMLPLELNSRVRFRRRPAGLDLYAVLQKQTIRTGLGAVVTSTIREVVS